MKKGKRIYAAHVIYSFKDTMTNTALQVISLYVNYKIITSLKYPLDKFINIIDHVNEKLGREIK
jgi:hypothetical protein